MPNNAPVALLPGRIAEVLENQKGATFISFVSHTEPKMRKRGNPFSGNLRKVSRVNGQINFWYDAAVRRQLEKEGKSPDDFRRGESWHEPEFREDGTLTPFCVHKVNGTRYLRFRCLQVLDSRYETLDGVQVPKEAVEPYLSPSSDYANQGCDSPVVFLCYKLAGIKELTLGGVVYVF